MYDGFSMLPLPNRRVFFFSLKQSRYLYSLLSPQSQSSFASPQLISQKKAASCPTTLAKYRNFDLFPFQFDDGFFENPSHFLSYLTNLLGSTNSDRNALHLKPFSTSVQNVLNFVITTTTKICTKVFSNRAHALSSPNTSRSSTHQLNTYFILMVEYKRTVQRHPFSGLYLSACELLRIHYRMTASMSTVKLSMK